MLKLTTILLLLISFLCKANTTKFPPKDESKKIPEFALFINELKQVVKDKNAVKLYAMLDTNIKIDFDEGVGIEKFKTKWNPEKSNSELWIILNKIIGFGGVFEKKGNDSSKSFIFPYIYQVELEDADDYFSTLVVIDSNVSLRKQPSYNSKIISILSYDLVKFNYKKSSHYWYYVETFDKKFKGYLEKSKVWSPIDYRLYISNESGEVKIKYFVTGD